MRIATAIIASLGLTALPALGQDPDSVEAAWLADPTRIFDASEIDLDELQWIARPVVVFANSPRDPAFVQQMEELVAEFDRLVERDVIVIVDSDADSGSSARERLRPRGFMLVLIGKDGEVKLRKPLPWSVREISRSIDKTPMRQREEAEGRDGRIDG
ncbi:DUF4174 domain-containing protein [Jannaschia formosa]|uniref:DUF4174 domain-containing protein n=1 Tax=Jannaschia formosa TaxID=2259592 RepID=UPI000E1BCC17|nr:DUF4174 domain-containing protein [Jannaschia formosa]TFL16703.1 DUF4174 domain-containing protein [Jannaschia formosa]